MDRIDLSRLPRADNRYFTNVSRHSRSPFDACKVCMQLWARMPRSALSNFLAKVVRDAPFSNQPSPVGLVGHVYPTRVCCLPNGSKRGGEGEDGEMGRGEGFHSLSGEVARKMSNIGGNSRSIAFPPPPLFLSRRRRYIRPMWFYSYEWRYMNWKLEGSMNLKWLYFYTTNCGMKFGNWYISVSIGNLDVCRFYLRRK